MRQALAAGISAQRQRFGGQTAAHDLDSADGRAVSELVASR
jgi:hypothetical protein